jgi:hypothetical protein
MPSQVNILVFVHGMTPDVAPSDPRKPGATYDKFWEALQAHQPELTALFPDGPILVEWGHQLSSAEDAVREDHKLTEIERFVRSCSSPHNSRSPGERALLGLQKG